MRGQAGDEHLPDIRRGRIGGKPIRRHQRLDLPVRKLLFEDLPHPEGQAPVIICYLPRILFAQPGGKVDGRGPLPGVEQRLALAPGIEKHRLPVLRASPVHQAQVDARERIRDDLRRREAQGIFRRGSASLEVSAQRAPQHPRHIVERIILYCRFALRQKQRRPQPRLHRRGFPVCADALEKLDACQQQVNRAVLQVLQEVLALPKPQRAVSPRATHADLPRPRRQALVPAVHQRLQRHGDHDRTPSGDNPGRRGDFHDRPPAPPRSKHRPQRPAAKEHVDGRALRLAKRPAAVQVDGDALDEGVRGEAAPAQAPRLSRIRFVERRIVPVDMDIYAEAAIPASGNLCNSRRIPDPGVDRRSETRRDSRAEIADLRPGRGDDLHGMGIVGVVRLTAEHQRIAGTQRPHRFLPAFKRHARDLSVKRARLFQPQRLLGGVVTGPREEPLDEQAAIGQHFFQV